MTWGGHRYWMAMTPFPLASEPLENPSILCSDDGETWAVPAGLTNPIEAAPAVGYNSDPELVMDADSVLWCVWRSVDEAANEEHLYTRSSVDGVTWSDRALVLTGGTGDDPDDVVSPTVVRTGDVYRMWYVQADPRKLYMRTASALTGPWSDVVECELTVPGGGSIWHIDVFRHGSSYAMLYCALEIDYGLYVAWSPDGIQWTSATSALIPRDTTGDQWDSSQLYRASAIPYGDGYRVYYSARKGARWNESAIRIGLTTMELP